MQITDLPADAAQQVILQVVNQRVTLELLLQGFFADEQELANGGPAAEGVAQMRVMPTRAAGTYTGYKQTAGLQRRTCTFQMRDCCAVRLCMSK